VHNLPYLLNQSTVLLLPDGDKRFFRPQIYKWFEEMMSVLIMDLFLRENYPT